MPTQTLLRLLAICIVVVVAIATRGSRVWYFVVANVGFGHYLIGLLYSRRQLTRVARRREDWPRLLALLLAGIGLFVLRFPLLVFFGVHHAFNETYLSNQGSPSGSEPQLRWLRSSRLALNLVLYFFLVRRNVHVSFGERPTIFVGLSIVLAATYATYFAMLYRSRTSFTSQQLVDNCSIEVAAIALVAISFFVRVTYLHIVLYHFVFWTMFPIQGLVRRGAADVARYVGITVGVTGAIVGLELLVPGLRMGAGGTMWRQFLFWSYLHITLTLAISAANPAWIRRLFERSPRLVPASLQTPAEA